jgi:hypothetical protein
MIPSLYLSTKGTHQFGGQIFIIGCILAVSGIGFAVIRVQRKPVLSGGFLLVLAVVVNAVRLYLPSSILRQHLYILAAKRPDYELPVTG